jgi:hypothetical protein
VLLIAMLRHPRVNVHETHMVRLLEYKAATTHVLAGIHVESASSGLLLLYPRVCPPTNTQECYCPIGTPYKITDFTHTWLVNAYKAIISEHLGTDSRDRWSRWDMWFGEATFGRFVDHDAPLGCSHAKVR